MMGGIIYIRAFLLALLAGAAAVPQSVNSHFSLIQEIDVGSASTGGINDVMTGVDLDRDGHGEIIVQAGLSSYAKAIIYEWDGVDSYDETWSVSLPINNSSSDQVHRLLAVDDTDGDGYLELFVGTTTTTSANARIYCYEMSNGILSTQNPSKISKGPDGGYFQGNTRIRAIVTGNSDRDSFGELYVGNSGNTTSLEIWEADGNDSWVKVALTGVEKDIGDGIMDMAPPADLDNDGKKDDIAICEEQGGLSVLDFSTLEDPISKTVNNKNDTGTNTSGRVVIYNLDDFSSPEIIISNNIDDGILVYEWVPDGNAFSRDNVDKPLLVTGKDIYGIGASDYDNDGKGEIYITYEDSLLFFEYNGTNGDFDSSADFSSSVEVVTNLLNQTFVVQPSSNRSTTLLDGDQFRDFVLGTDGNGISGRGEIFILESKTESIIPKSTLSGNSGFRMMSSPVSGKIFSDLLAELWTQGMSGGDVSSGSPNVWLFDIQTQSWTPLNDLNTDSLAAGEGFLVYVFDDVNMDGTADLPVHLSVTGTGNNTDVVLGNISDGNWALAGNPYSSTLDWDGVSKTALSASVYIWDDALSTYKSWNGITGSLSDGLIAPYQGFWIQASGGTGSMTIRKFDEASTRGPFYKQTGQKAGSVQFFIQSGGYADQFFISFSQNGKTEIDRADAYKLLPLNPVKRVLGLSYTDGLGLDINNLPLNHKGPISIPLDFMFLNVDENGNFAPEETILTLTWTLENLAEDISLILKDNFTGELIGLSQKSETTFTTKKTEAFPSIGAEAINAFTSKEGSRFSLEVEYNALSSDRESSVFPERVKLFPPYPNPFNPTTTLFFTIPEIKARENSMATLRVYNIGGHPVETLIDRALSPGSHQIKWAPVGLSSGLYIIQLRVENKISSKKVIFIK